MREGLNTIQEFAVKGTEEYGLKVEKGQVKRGFFVVFVCVCVCVRVCLLVWKEE